MAARRQFLAAVAALGLWGCGSEEDIAEPTPTPPARTGTAPPDADPAAAADALAVRCGLVRPVPGKMPEIVPAGLLPTGSYIARGRRTGSSARATVLIPTGLPDTLAEISRRAPAAGYKVAFSENEGVEAEIYLSGPGGLTKFRIFKSRSCPDTASQALFERAYTEG